MSCFVTTGRGVLLSRPVPMPDDGVIVFSLTSMVSMSEWRIERAPTRFFCVATYVPYSRVASSCSFLLFLYYVLFPMAT